jgi:HSP20 family protein
MANVAVEKLESKEAMPLPLFEELEKRFDEVRRRAFDLFEKRGREFGHALDDWLKAEHEVMGWPKAVLRESGNQFDIELTLPGYEPKDVKVTATPTEIHVHARAEEAKKDGEAKIVWSEFSSNDVFRHFRFPQDIDAGTVKASLEKGILHVTAMKKTPVNVRPIDVKAA